MYQYKPKCSLTGSATFGLSMQRQHGIYFEIQIKLQYANNNPDTNKATDANTNKPLTGGATFGPSV